MVGGSWKNIRHSFWIRRHRSWQSPNDIQIKMENSDEEPGEDPAVFWSVADLSACHECFLVEMRDGNLYLSRSAGKGVYANEKR